MRRLLAIALAVAAPAAATLAQGTPVLPGTYITGNDTDAGDLFGECVGTADVPSGVPTVSTHLLGPASIPRKAT